MAVGRHIDILRAGLSRACCLRADLERELAEIADSTSQVPDDEHDAEGSTLGYERARASALLAATRREIDDLTDALARATGDDPSGSGGYGRCLRCGAPIGPDRLAALPAATTCITCAPPESTDRFRLVR